MEWRDIPSLAALRGFEAAARLGSLSAAARSLNVTHAAVAQHVRALEDHFGCALLERDGRGMCPTPEGVTLAKGLAEGFSAIAAAVRDLALDEDRPIRITMTPSFAENWLMPVIGAFWSAHPEIRLELVPSETQVDLRAEGIDLAIRHGRGGWPGTDPVPLASASHVAVAAPQLLEGHAASSLADLADLPWLLWTGRREEKDWAAEQGLDLDRVRVLDFETSTMLLQAVRGAAGVSIVPAAIVSRDIAEGRLIAVSRAEGSEFAYHLIRRPGPAPQARETFIAWLRRVAGDRA